MLWTTPEFTEIKMDAEVGSYQPDDFDGPGQDPMQAPSVASAAPASPPAAE